MALTRKWKRSDSHQMKRMVLKVCFLMLARRDDSHFKALFDQGNSQFLYQMTHRSRARRKGPRQNQNTFTHESHF